MTGATRSLAIERVTLDELGDVVDLFCGYLEFYRRPRPRADAEAFLRERLTRDESIVYVARLDGAPVGFTQVYPTFSSVSMAPVWVLNDLFVAAGVRRSGAGRALIRTVLEQAAAAGAVRVVLSTAEDNTTAQALYESEGFVQGAGYREYIKKV